MPELTINSQQRCFDGTQGFYSHQSEITGGTMNFAVFQPPQARQGASVPLLIFLSGLTCSEENFTVKAGAQRLAAELGLMLLVPDTSPRGAAVAGEDESYDLGTGAGFYVDATQEPWSPSYRMYSYITEELPMLIAEHFPADMARQGIFGHSMGGHGALTLHLKNPDVYRTVSAFSPICAPMRCPWGEKALNAYLGTDRDTWRPYDACALLEDGVKSEAVLLIDQGAGDAFLEEQLQPQLLAAACQAAGQEIELRMQPDYDHSYYFIATFMEEHLRHHARVLSA